MRYHPDIHRRRSIRLPTYDYSQSGAYFVTVCTYIREILLDNGDVGEAVQRAWEELAQRFSVVALDEFVIMPNHVHGIIFLRRRSLVGAQHGAVSEYALSADDISLTTQIVGPADAAPLHPAVARRSLGAIVRAFKSVATKRINRLRGTPGSRVWQRNYYERIIRGEDELARIRQYILDNPAKWAEDKNNPLNWR